MKTLLKTILFPIILMFSVTASNSASSTGGGSGNPTCTAIGTFGGSCTVTCSPGQKPVCTAGVINPSCTCVGEATGGGLRDMSNITNQIINDVNLFKTHCTNSTSAGLQGLVPFIDDVLNNINNNNQVGYDAAEDAYADYFINNLSYNDKTEVNNFVISLGYPGFTI